MCLDFKLLNAIWLDKISLCGPLVGIETPLSQGCKTHPLIFPLLRMEWGEPGGSSFPHSLLLVLLVALQCKFVSGDHCLIRLRSVLSTHHHGMRDAVQKGKLFIAKSFLWIEISLPMGLDDMPAITFFSFLRSPSSHFWCFCMASCCPDLEICLAVGAARMGSLRWGGSSAHPTPSRSSTSPAQGGLATSKTAAERGAGTEYFLQFVQEVAFSFFYFFFYFFQRILKC